MSVFSRIQVKVPNLKRAALFSYVVYADVCMELYVLLLYVLGMFFIFALGEGRAADCDLARLLRHGGQSRWSSPGPGRPAKPTST